MLRSLHSLRLPRAVPQRRAASIDDWLAVRALDAASTTPEAVALRWLFGDMMEGFAPADRATAHGRWRCLAAQVQALLIHPWAYNHSNVPAGVGNAALLPDAAGANAPPAGRLPATQRASLAHPDGPFGPWRAGNAYDDIIAQVNAEGGLVKAFFGNVVGGQFDFSGRVVRLAPGRYRIRDYASLRPMLCTPQHNLTCAIGRAAGYLCTIGGVDNHDPMVVWAPEHNKWIYSCETFCEELRHPLVASSLSNAELLHLSVGGGWGPVYTDRHPVQTWENGGKWMVDTPQTGPGGIAAPPASVLAGGVVHQVNTYRWAHPAGTGTAGAMWGVLGTGYRFIDSQGLREGYLHATPEGRDVYPAWPEPEAFPHLGLGAEGETFDASQGSWTFRTVPPVRHPLAVMEVYVATTAEWQPSTGSHTVGPGQSVTVRALHPETGDLLALDTFTA